LIEDLLGIVTAMLYVGYVLIWWRDSRAEFDFELWASFINLYYGCNFYSGAS